MNVIAAVKEQTGESAPCTVVVIYEDAVTRQRAMTACDFLMQRLWHEVELEFHWWRADFLAHAIMADAAARQAAEADFLIFCSRAESDCSPTLKNWFESWIGDRQGRDGLLLNLSATRGLNAGTARPAESFLRGIARRARLDYFATGPLASIGILPASLEEAEQRASKISSVLDEILHPPPRPPSFGLND